MSRLGFLPFLALGLICCDGDSTGPKTEPVASVQIDPLRVSFKVDQTVQFTATATDATGDVLSGRTITWSSSNTSVATVSEGGLVTGVEVGSATIMATSEGKSGSASVAVVAPLPFAFVSAGFDHTCGVTTGGEAYCWGAGYRGQLGNGSTEAKLVPTLVSGGLTFAIGVGWPHLRNGERRPRLHLRRDGGWRGLLLGGGTERTPRERVNRKAAGADAGFGWPHLRNGERRFVPHLRRDEGGRGLLLGGRLARTARERVNGDQACAHVGFGGPHLRNGRCGRPPHVRHDDGRRGLLLGVRLEWRTRDWFQGRHEACADVGLGGFRLRNGRRRFRPQLWCPHVRRDDGG